MGKKKNENEKEKYYFKDKILINKFCFDYEGHEDNNIIPTNKNLYVYTNCTIILFLEIKDKISVILKQIMNYQISRTLYTIKHNMLKFKNYLLICAKEGIIIYDLKKRREKEIVKLDFETATSIINLSNGNLLFGVIDEIKVVKKALSTKGSKIKKIVDSYINKYSIYEYQYTDKFLKINQIKKASKECDDRINALIELNENTIISGDSDIYFWTLKNKDKKIIKFSKNTKKHRINKK